MRRSRSASRRSLAGRLGLAAAAGLLSLAAAGPAYADEARLVFTVDIPSILAAEQPATFRVDQGATVELDWQSDRAVEIHLHGYDLLSEVAPGDTPPLVFEATVSGRFPATLHGDHHDHGDEDEHGEHGERTLFYLEVYPN